MAETKILEVEIDDLGAMELAKRSRGTPRIANRILRRTRDFAQVKAKGKIDEKVASHEHRCTIRRSPAAPATPARRLLRSESRRSSSPRHSSWSLSFSAEIFSAAWRAPMSSNMERVAAMPDASLYVNRDGRRADDCVDSHGGGNLTKIPRSGVGSQKFYDPHSPAFVSFR